MLRALIESLRWLIGWLTFIRSCRSPRTFVRHQANRVINQHIVRKLWLGK